MKDILLETSYSRIECEVNGLELTYTFSDDPKYHYKVQLRNPQSYRRLKAEVTRIYEEYSDPYVGYEDVYEFLQSREADKFFIEGSLYVERDLRDREEIEEYCNEATDKVWLMRTHPCYDRRGIEVDRQSAVKRILRTYNDIPDDSYTDWECGYWNGIMGALRWVLGDDKDYLDT